MPGSPVPNSETELIVWLTNFTAKLPKYLTTLGLTGDEWTEISGDAVYTIWLLKDYTPNLRKGLAAAVEFKNFMKDGDASARLPEVVPGTTPPEPYTGTLPPAGTLIRLRQAVQNIKTRKGYTDAIGEDLNIITHAETGGPEAPTLSLSSFHAGSVALAWNKSGWTGIKMQSRGEDGGGWKDLGVNLRSPFADSRPLAVPGRAEVREYRACYLDGDTPHDAWSQTLSVTVLA